MQSRLLRGGDCPHCEWLSLHTLRSRKALFEEGAFTRVPRRGGGGAVPVLVGNSDGSDGGNEDGEPLSSSFPIRSSARSAVLPL